MKVLICDDNKDFVSMIYEFLSTQEGIDVVGIDGMENPDEIFRLMDDGKINYIISGENNNIKPMIILLKEIIPMLRS